MEIILFLFIIAAYFLPSIVAVSRKHNSTVSVCLLNLFAGWTVIGWLAALIWSASNSK